MNLNRILGPAVMGLIVAQLSYEAAYYLSIALYSLAIACMFGVDRSRSDESGAEKKPLLADIALGFSYIRANRPVLICLLFGLLPMFLAMPFQNILVMLAEQAWNVGESGVGTLMATGGAGGVVGALWVVKRGDDAGRMKMMLGSTIGFGICLAIFVLTPVFTVALLPLLAEAGYAFEEIAADSNPALRAELLQRSGQSTLPQIFVGDESVGGYRELTIMLSNGRFAQLLERD